MKELEALWSGHDEKEAKHILNTKYPDKMMLKMQDGLFVIVEPEAFIKAAKA
jgi:hypothetical protein